VASAEVGLVAMGIVDDAYRSAASSPVSALGR
jgi:hypothetical protein